MTSAHSTGVRDLFRHVCADVSCCWGGVYKGSEQHASSDTRQHLTKMDQQDNFQEIISRLIESGVLPDEHLQHIMAAIRHVQREAEDNTWTQLPPMEAIDAAMQQAYVDSYGAVIFHLWRL